MQKASKFIFLCTCYQQTHSTEVSKKVFFFIWVVHSRRTWRRNTKNVFKFLAQWYFKQSL